MKHKYPSIWFSLRTCVSAIALALFAVCQAAHVPESVARQAGEQFFAMPSIGREAVDLTLVYSANTGTTEDLVTCFYIFNEASGAFVIVAGDDIVQPVLAYSTERSFEPADLPINVAKWLEGYKTEILIALEYAEQASDETQAAWQSLLSGQGLSTSVSSERSVNPLVQTTWNQSPYYNAQCPGGSVTGCVATAMAQIMKFWNYPATGSGFHQYNHPQYGTLSANFGATSYQWASMPNNVSGPNSSVATLMYHCGVGVDMQYSPQVSGAWVIEDHSPGTQNNAEYALKTYFGYQPSLNGVARANYTQTQWINLLRGELDAGRPILHDGFGDGGGHAFVCDGYDDNNYFHFNWGWAGAYDGYFTVNALNPSGTGTGGGSGGYNSGQEAVIGIQPPSGSTTFDMELYDYVSPTSSTLYYGQAFSVTSNIHNNGTNTFSGDYCAAAFDSDNNFVGYIEILSGYNLLPNNVYTNGLTFSTTGMFSMVPGDYSIGVFYRPTGGNWVAVSDSWPYTNFESVTVINQNGIELNSAMVVSPGGNLVQGGQVSVNLNIVNNSVSTFIGDYGVALYNLDGTWAQDIGTINEGAGLPVGYTYLPPYLTFGPATVTVTPGTYLLAAEHNPNGIGWELTGTGNFTNPITVIVTAPGISPDIYEVNNVVGQAYTLPVNFSGNNASPNSNGSNLHITSDLDHYKVVLPGGFNYSVTARLHDSYNSGNGNTYTADALFSWSSDGTNWSSTFDDVMPGTIPVSGGGTIYFRVAPFFAGEVGTYLLQLNLTRAAVVGIEDVGVLEGIKVFPNPVSEVLSIDMGDEVVQVDRLILMDVQGSVVKDIPQSQLTTGVTTIDVSALAVGCYSLTIHAGGGRSTQRVIIAR